MKRFLLTLVVAGSSLLVHHDAYGVDPIVPEQIAATQQSYVVIDASSTSTGGRKVDLVALTEDNQLKFSYDDSVDSIGPVYTVKTWTQGSVVDVMTRSFPLAIGYTGDDGNENIRCLDPNRLTSGGVVFGNSFWNGDDGDTIGPLFSCAGTQPNDPNLGNLQPTDIDFGNGLEPTYDHPWYLGDTAYVDGMGPSLIYVANNGTYCAREDYEGVQAGQNSGFDPSVIGDESHIQDVPALSYDHFLYFTPKTTFDPHTYTLAPPQAGAPQDVSFPRRHDLFYPTLINGQGWCAGFQRPIGSTSTVLLWNAQTQALQNCGVGYPVAMSEANDLLINGNGSGDSYLIEQGDTTHTRYFESGSADQRLIPKNLQTKIRSIAPFAMSDRATRNSTVVYPVLHILFTAEVCVNVKDNQWAYETFLLRLFSDESTDLHQIGSVDPTTETLSFNDGTITISKIACINSSGVIAAIGNAGTGNGHALLLYPLDVVEDTSDNSESNNSSTNAILPTPNALTNKNGKVLNRLAVGKMDDGTISGNGASATIDPDNDVDDFYVRIKGAAGTGITSVKVSSVENPYPEYNDGPVTLDLHVEGKDLVSKSLLLTSDDVDDQVKVDDVMDNAKNDRTYKIQLGGKFAIVSSQRNNKDEAIGEKLLVPSQRTVYVHPIIVKSYENSDPLTSKEQAENQLLIARERYAQIGIKLAWSPVTIVNPVKGADINLGFSVVDAEPKDGAAVLSQQAKLVISAYGTINNNLDIYIFWINTVNHSFDGETTTLGGYAVAPFYFSPADSAYFNNCFIASNQGPFVVAHELGHLLTNDAHENDSHNVMWGKDQSMTNTITAHKRFNKVQERIIMLANPPIGAQ